MAHAHRIYLRREVRGGGEEEKELKPLRIDACVVCFGRERDHAIIPCYHMCVCRSCSERLHKCPICRGEVASVKRIYY